MTAYAFSLATMLLWLELHLSEKMQRMFGGGDGAGVAAAPPILSQEASCFRWLAVSFALVTLTLLSGALAAKTSGGDIFALTHKNLFAILT